MSDYHEMWEEYQKLEKEIRRRIIATCAVPAELLGPANTNRITVRKEDGSEHREPCAPEEEAS